MSSNTDHIRVTHAGSLPRTPELLAANEAKEANGITPEFLDLLETSVIDVVARQRNLGIDIPNDGEYGHAMASSVDYGAWWNYSFARLGGLEPTNVDRWADAEVHRSSPGNIVLTSFPDRRDRQKFNDAYNDPSSGILAHRKSVTQPKIAGPLTYTGHDLVKSDVTNLKKGLDAAGLSEGFVAALSPGSCARVANEYYKTDEELLYACADAMREEYKAIIDAGLTVQLDDPSLAESWDQINPEPSLEDYLKFIQLRVEATNWALRDLPQEQIRLHVCWGSWHGPHTTDIPFADIIDSVLQIDAGAYSFEAANVRHEHEWRIWEDTKLPEGKSIIPGVVSHATNVVEHPELVADRIERFARLVGRENVIASTDCGLGGRVHPQIAIAKLEALGQGAELATKRLWK
ncbi:cobalamin-independent methionine synthase II family protein [Arthrobacter crystallopoietes]|uniref:cobalamin-independent methionine synthase II family protein n=1 Tax=Crystallibacter crystallopoietes TaxID=37928 RepID=UPI001ABE0B33|nr:cobalamin-independent methionine synthase II family protein [Arthrobacter crystallopoietes]QTG82000.1 cobalamin-independent methionine synthase II family protein [Arthrobacter crystallopoietes]